MPPGPELLRDPGCAAPLLRRRRGYPRWPLATSRRERDRDRARRPDLTRPTHGPSSTRLRARWRGRRDPPLSQRRWRAACTPTVSNPTSSPPLLAAAHPSGLLVRRRRGASTKLGADLGAPPPSSQLGAPLPHPTVGHGGPWPLAASHAPPLDVDLGGASLPRPATPPRPAVPLPQRRPHPVLPHSDKLRWRHVPSPSLQRRRRLATPPAARWSGCRITLPVGGYFRWFGVDVHRFERGTLEAEERGWIRAVLDPTASSPPTLLQAPSTSTINRELALSDTGTTATPSDFSVAPRPVNHDASANCSTKCPGGAVNMVARAVKSAVAMAPVIISTHAADTPTTIDVVCSVVTFDVDSGVVVSATVNIASTPEVLPVTVKVLDREMLKCGGDFFKLYACNLIDVSVALGRICDVVVVQSSLFPSSDWLEQQPWPPPDDLRLTSSDAALRRTPWLSFNMVEICSVSYYRGHVWKPPWPIQIGHQIRLQLRHISCCKWRVVSRSVYPNWCSSWTRSHCCRGSLGVDDDAESLR